MKKYFILAVFFYSVLFFGCRSEESREAVESEKSPADEIRLSDDTLRRRGIRTDQIGWRFLSTTIKASGVITFNQKRYLCITSRVAGRIEEVDVFEGDRVKSGQKLLALYSPDYLAAQQELLQLTLQQERQKKGGDEEAAPIVDRMLDSAARKLHFMGITEAEIEAIRKNKSLTYLLVLRAPFEGSIVRSNVLLGDYIETGAELFRLADLKTLWAEVNFYEKDLALVSPGSSVEIRVQAYQGEVFSGTMTVLSDVLDEETRTVKGRVEVSNPLGKLKPGMYAEAILTTPARTKVLAVPESAIRNVEGRSIVFVLLGEKTFVPREVKLGRNSGGFTEVLEGLVEGEEVVTEGSFVLKSELLKKTLEGEDE